MVKNFRLKKSTLCSHIKSLKIILLLLELTMGVSVDCPNIINLAIGLNMDAKAPVLLNQLKTDCCAASGVTCDGSSRVTAILWDQKGLDGTINGTAFPSTLNTFDVSSNRITGELPTIPAGMLYFYVGDNRMTGTIPANLPNGLIYLELDTNNFHGDLPDFPLSLTALALGYVQSPKNRFSGTLRLNKPNYLFIIDNFITDIIIQDISLLTANCDISRNPLLGNPRISNLTGCTKVGLYSPDSLPVTISSTAKTTNTISTITSQQYPQLTSRSEVQNTTFTTQITTISPFVNTFPSKGITVVITLKSFLKCLLELTVLIIVLMKTPRHKKAKKISNRFTTRQTEDFA